MNKQVLISIGIIVFPAILLSGCCGDIYKGKQSVNVSPLYELNLHLENVEEVSDIVDTTAFDYLEPDIQNTSIIGSFYGNGRISVLIMLEPDKETAAREFQSACGYLPRVVYGGREENQYCMSDVRELRASPESLCQRTGEYNSSINFLKDRLVIYMDRYTGDVESPELDKAILELSQAFKQ